MAKILIVEDNEQLGEMLVDRLSRRGHIALLVAEKDPAFASAKASSPDVILLESQLRGGDVWAFAHRLKGDDHTREIPIIALMGENSEETQGLARQAGAAELHVKPIDFVRLLQQINAVAPDPEAAVSQESAP
jgi:two-component system phosphate regulon response regulator PhoB